MEKRDFPNCHSKLGDQDGYYCSSCGEKLPKDLIQTNKAIRIRTYSPSEPDVAKGPARANLIRKLKNKTFWLIFLLVVFIFAVFVSIANTGIVELFASKLSLGPEFENISISLPSVKPEVRTVKLGIAVAEGTFGEKGFASHVPAEVDFYFEGTNLSQLLSLSLFGEEENNFSPKAKILLEPEFAGFSYAVEGENRWAFIFTPKDFQIAQDVFGNGWNDYWKIAFLPDYMILANNEDVFGLVKAVDSGLNLSLAQNPEYVKDLKPLNDMGQLQLFLMTSRARAIVKESMGGFTQGTIGMINKILSSEFDSLVITNSDGQN